MADTNITIGDKELLELLVASTTLRQSAARVERELIDMEERISEVEKSQTVFAEKIRTNPDSALSPHALSLRVGTLDAQISQLAEGNKAMKMWMAGVSTGVVVGLIVMLAQNLRWSGAASKQGRIRESSSTTPHALFQTAPKPRRHSKG